MIWTEDKNIWNWLPKLQAHRGYWVKGLQQNSLQSVQQAFEQKYQISEFDVRMTSDGVVVMFHDDSFQDLVLSKTTFYALNEAIPVTPLEELFKWLVKVPDFKLNIEIKSRKIVNSLLEKKVCELIRKYKIEERVMISSFNPFTLYKVRRYCPKVYRALLLTFEKNYGNNFVIKSRVLNYMCRPHMLNLRAEDFSRRFVKLAKKIPVVLWTVNDVNVYKKSAANIHGIISDQITPAEFKTIQI
ncbi:glycerophosphodiester phosphodiesterase [bacterium]|nr:glycerophosphodiester phosphodiesterase [bacterium]